MELYKFVPISKEAEFRSIWETPDDQVYTAFKKKFLEILMPDHLAIRKARLAIKLTDYSSTKRFLTDKIEALIQFERFTKEQALERAFYELNDALVAKYYRLFESIDEYNLMSFVQFEDERTAAQFASLMEDTDAMDMNESTESQTSPETSTSIQTPEAYSIIVDHGAAHVFNNDDDEESEMPEQQSPVAPKPKKRGRGRPRRNSNPIVNRNNAGKKSSR